MHIVTQCPACQTCFEAGDEQLKISQGWVRCGHCSEVFNGQVHALVPPPLDYLEESLTVQSEPLATARDEKLSSDSGYLLKAPAVLEDDSPESPLFIQKPQRERPTFTPHKKRHQGNRRWIALAIFLLGIALTAQLVGKQLDRIAALFPSLSIPLKTLCTNVGCAVRPLQRPHVLRIEAAELNKIDGVGYQLRVTLLNDSYLTNAVPSLEVTLKDTGEKVWVRKVFEPPQWGIPANSVMQAHAQQTVQIYLAPDNAIQLPLNLGFEVVAFYP